jgi:hypothetical protein
MLNVTRRTPMATPLRQAIRGIAGAPVASRDFDVEID